MIMAAARGNAKADARCTILVNPPPSHSQPTITVHHPRPAHPHPLSPVRHEDHHLVSSPKPKPVNAAHQPVKNSEPASTPHHWSFLPTQPRPPSLWRIILRDFFCKHRTDTRTRALAALSHPSPSADFPAPSGSLLASC